ncbi:MAG: glycoside hydrolase, partial [Bacteroidales bacterium]|nr:glycoside hydrolase [Bacteroidales bacterium]
MKKTKILFISVVTIILFAAGINWAVSSGSKDKDNQEHQVDTRVDNNRYWIRKAEAGLVLLNPYTKVESSVYTGSTIKSTLVVTRDSPDVAVTTESSTQSENSVFIDPSDNETILNSNNSTTNPAADNRSLYGANDLYSFDGGTNWEGEIAGAGGNNSGDPTTAINLNGRWFVGYITSSLGQGVSYSDDQGDNWIKVTVSGGGGATLDKNHLWVDNSPTSPYKGNLYDSWTPLGYSHPNDSEIELSLSDDDGVSWSSPKNISSAVNAGSHNQGVNISTGPNGEVYAIWAIYDSWPSDETAIGFAKSLNGGITWVSASRIIENIRGIRTSETSKNMRVNFFPVMDVDISTGIYQGNIYVVWSNIGEPGVNTGNDIDAYMIISSDKGENWTDPIRINQDAPGQGNEHYFPWVACDPETGSLSVIYYDDRNVSLNQCETYCSNSLDGGQTWEDIKVSDVSFTPTPIPGLASGYFGDYLGIVAKGGNVYPCWTDNRSGSAMTYVSPYQLINAVAPYNLTSALDEETGEVELNWEFNEGYGFNHFNIYRDETLLGTSIEKTYEDQLPDYGYYTYSVKASYDGDILSASVSDLVQWGNAQISVNPESISKLVLIGEISTEHFSIFDNGELPLNYNISLTNSDSKSGNRDYCSAGGGCGIFIDNVEVGDISNPSVCDGYADYTGLSTQMLIGNEYEINVFANNSNPMNRVGIWIDWNQNEDFTDDELIAVSTTSPFTASVSPPLNAIDGPTRMRIRIVNLSNLEPCGTVANGEVEDYTINVIDWISIDPTQGSIASGDSAEIEITIDGSKREEGIYFYDLTISSNDPDDPEVIIPFDLTIVPMLLEINADPAEICPGNSSQLSVTVNGGSGSYTYSWISIPEGFTSTEQNPVFSSITETTIFIVEVDDGENQISEQTTLTVNPLPEIDLGNDQSICQGEEVTFDAGAGDVEYLWQDGSSEQTFTANQTGTYWVQLTNEFGCLNSDTVDLFVNSLPLVELGNDSVICAGQSITLDAGNPGSTYLWSTGQTEQTIVVDTTAFGLGIFDLWVEVTNLELCINTDTISIGIEDCSGVNEIINNLSLNIFPNPSDGHFTVTFNSKKHINVNLKIISNTGNIVF